MNLTVNGNNTSFQDIKTVTDLLSVLKLEPDTVVVEHNTLIIQPENHAVTILRDGDQVEIIRFVGGG